MLTAFHWIIDRRLAGSGRPGLLAELGEDLAFVQEQGIRTIISLTEAPFDTSRTTYQFEHLHFPIPDMGFPTPHRAGQICDAVTTSMRAGPVLLHCHAGLGRTGTLAACCLVARGEAPERALRRVRTIEPRYVQTGAQERFIHHFAHYVRERAAPS